MPNLPTNLPDTDCAIEAAIRTRRHAYAVHDLLAEGDSSNLYLGEGEGGERVVIKLARDPADNDLLANEALTLKQMLAPEEFASAAQPYFPQLLESFGYQATPERPRHGNVFLHVSRLVSLEQVRGFYLEGVAPKDMAWVFRRLLMAIGFAHAQGFVHGAVLPSHVLIQPEEHGLVLVDWKYATHGGRPVEAISASYRDWYPPEVLNGGRVSPATDIFMAARCMEHLMGEYDVPYELSEFLLRCRSESQRRRPRNAWDLKEELDELLEAMWGPREFRPLPMVHGAP